MFQLLEDDPAFRPLVLRSSLGTKEINNIADENSDDSPNGEDHREDNPGPSASTSSTSNSCRPKKKRKVDDVKEYLAERDDKFLSMMKEMQEKQNKLLEKLIDKL